MAAEDEHDAEESPEGEDLHEDEEAVEEDSQNENEDEDEDEEEGTRLVRAPWHFKVIVVGTVVYLGWRLYQGITWLVHHI